MNPYRNQVPVHDALSQLDDESAVRLLSTVIEAHAAGASETTWSPACADAVRAHFGAPPAASAPVTDGDLARAALSVLAEQPETGERIAALPAPPSPDRFGVGTTIAVIVAALVVLQTRVDFVREDGKTSIKIHKPSASNETLRALAHKLLSFTSGR